MREYFLDIPTILIAAIIYIYIIKLSIDVFLLKKQLILILFIVQILGLIYDGIVILLGFSMSESVLMFFNKFRFIFHGLLVPLLIIFCGNALNLKGKFFYLNLLINIILSIFGIILGIICNLDIVDENVLKRCNFSSDEKKFIKISFTLMNIGCVIYMIVAGIILYVKKKDYYFFLSGFFMLLFSAIGPAVGKSNLNYLLSMYGEVLMIIFLYFFFKNKTQEPINIKQIEMGLDVD